MVTKAKQQKTAGRPKGSSKKETLAKILPAARKLFAEKGFAQTTFKDVGLALGISHAALYSYFSSKTELYLAVLQDTQALLMPDYLTSIEQNESLRDKIKGILLASADAHDRDSSITGFLAAVPIEVSRQPELADKLLTGQDNPVLHSLHTLFDQARANGEITSSASTEDLVAALFGGGVGVALFQYGVSGSSLRPAMDVYVQMMESCLFTKN